MKKEIFKNVVIDLVINIVLGLFIGWIISQARENVPPFYIGGIVLGGVSLIRSFLKIKKHKKLAKE